MIRVGEKAPGFSLEGVHNGEFRTVSLDDFKGKWLVFFFYPLDFTFVCPTEINGFSDRLSEFKERGAEVVGVSVDSKFSHLAWSKTPRKQGGIQGLEYPLLSDINKNASVDYGVLQESSGVALRGLFIIDPDGVLQIAQINNLSIGRSVDETLRLIDALEYSRKHGEVCPLNWRKGAAAIKPAEAGKYFSKNAG